MLSRGGSILQASNGFKTFQVLKCRIFIRNDQFKMLFDNITRQDQSPRGHAEPLFTFLNRSSRQSSHEIRKLLEAWFLCYPPEHQSDLKARFRSDNDLTHQSAFFELYMHELLLKLGYEVDVHPEIEGVLTHPEFLVKRKGKGHFYLECTLAKGSHDDVATENVENRVYEALDRMDSPNFFIMINVAGFPKSSPPARKWRTYLEKKLSKLDPDKLGEILKKGGLEALPSWSTEFNGWRVTFRPIPKSPKKRGKPGIRPIGIRFSAVEWSKTHINIKNSINEKATKYGNLDLPYIIAINVQDFCCDDLDVMDGLFGNEITSVTINQNGLYEFAPGRKPNGAWIGPQGPQNTRNSAALIFRNLSWGNVAKETAILWHNPWAQKPLDINLWPLPQKIIYKDNGKIEFKRGKLPREIFDLPDIWPDIEERG